MPDANSHKRDRYTVCNFNLICPYQVTILKEMSSYLLRIDTSLTGSSKLSKLADVLWYNFSKLWTHVAQPEISTSGSCKTMDTMVTTIRCAFIELV